MEPLMLSCEEQRQRRLEAVKRYKKKYPERIKALRKRIYLKNRDKELQKMKEYYQNNTEKCIESAKKRYHKNKHNVPYEVTIWKGAKQRASKKNLEFTITPEDIIIPEHCPILGFELIRNKKVAKYNSPSLDRIDNTKGYTKENIQIISNRANILKSNGTAYEHFKISQFLTKLESVYQLLPEQVVSKSVKPESESTL